MKGSIVWIGKTHGPGSGEQEKHSGAGINTRQHQVKQL